MRVAVVTPFYNTPLDWLEQCHASVRAQTHACTHFLVSDGSGENPLRDYSGSFVRLEKPHADNGNTPRAAGSIVAIGEGYDAVTYLDADNWYRPDHIASLVTLHGKTAAPVCTSGRALCTLDGEPLGDCTESDGVHFADTSCLFLARPAFGLMPVWVTMPRHYSVICDFWMWSMIRRQRLATAHTGEHSMIFRTSYPHHYAQAGKTLPAGAKSAEYSADCGNKIFSLPQFFGADAATPGPRKRVAGS